MYLDLFLIIPHVLMALSLESASRRHETFVIRVLALIDSNTPPLCGASSGGRHGPWRPALACQSGREGRAKVWRSGKATLESLPLPLLFW